MHWRAASICLSGGAGCEAVAREKRSRRRCAASRVGESNVMKGMILAAGLGTRLRPLTNDRPKALVEVHGRTMLEITLSRLRQSGVHEVIINVHHLAEMVIDYLK